MVDAALLRLSIAMERNPDPTRPIAPDPQAGVLRVAAGSDAACSLGKPAFIGRRLRHHAADFVTRLDFSPSQVHHFHWEGIEIEETYVPRSWGGVIAHLEIESIQPPRAPLPISETGYRSHCHPCGTIEANGGDVVVQIVAWLNDEAAKREWRAYAAMSRQGGLFKLGETAQQRGFPIPPRPRNPSRIGWRNHCP